MKIVDTIKQSNETLYISVPKKIAELLNLQVGDVLEAEIKKIEK